MLHIGFSQYVPKDKILVITKADPAPLIRLKRELADVKKLIDCTSGRKAKSLIFLKGGFVVACARETDTLKDRIEGMHQ